jgi:hypothetical protein
MVNHPMLSQGFEHAESEWQANLVSDARGSSLIRETKSHDNVTRMMET